MNILDLVAKVVLVYILVVNFVGDKLGNVFKQLKEKNVSDLDIGLE